MTFGISVCCSPVVLHLVAAPVLVLLSAGLPVDAAYLDVSVTEYGAVGDGQKRCTEAFRRAIADISTAGSGMLRVPAGTFFTGPISLASHMVLWLSKGATLSADTDRQNLPLIAAIPAYGPTDPADPRSHGPHGPIDPRKVKADLRDAIRRTPPLLHGVRLENVTITGENGTLDGQGRDWWERWLTEPLDGRPHLIQFEKSRGVRIFNVTLVNPGFWAVHLWHCEYVHVRFLTVLVVPWDPPVRPTNTDGVNPDSSSHVVIEDSYFQTGDDAVAIKSGWDCFGREVGAPSKNITVRRIVVMLTRGCNAAGVAIGSEMSGGVDGVLIEDCHFINTGAAVEVKVGTRRGGYVRNIHARDLTIGETSRGALVVMAVYPEPNPFCSEPNPPVPQVSSLRFERIRVEGPTRGHLVQLQGTNEVFLNDVSVSGLQSENYGYGAWSCIHVSGLGTNNHPRECAALRKDGPRDADDNLPLPYARSPPYVRGVPFRPSSPHSDELQSRINGMRPPHSDELQSRTQESKGSWWSRAWQGAPPPAPPVQASQPGSGGKRWRNDGRCGFDFRNDEGQPGVCPTTEEFEAEEHLPTRQKAEAWLRNAHCCATSGWCGNADDHCRCYGCLDFNRRENRPAGETAVRKMDASQRLDPSPRHWARYQQPDPTPTERDAQSRWWQARPQPRAWRQQAAPPLPKAKRASRAHSSQEQVPASDEPMEDAGPTGGQPGPETLNEFDPEDIVKDAEDMSSRSSATEAEPPVRSLITALMFALCIFLCGLLMRRYMPSSRKHCVCIGGLACFALSPYLSVLRHHAFSPSLTAEEASSRAAAAAARMSRLKYTGKRRPFPRVQASAKSRAGSAANSQTARFMTKTGESASYQIPAPRAGQQGGHGPGIVDHSPGSPGATVERMPSQLVQESSPAKSDQDGNDAAESPAKLAQDSASASSHHSAGSGNDCFSKGEVTPVDFGGIGDGKADDTEAVRSCFVYVSRCRGTVAVVGPAGLRFLVRPGQLKVTLEDARIKFEGEIVGPSLQEWNPMHDIWPVGSCAYGETGCIPGQGQSPEFVRSQFTLLHILSSRNVTIEGPGGLRAPGQSFWTVRNRRPEVRGYCLLKLDHSTGLRVSGLALTDSPMYQLVVMQCKNVDLSGLSILVNDETVGEGGPHNTDGVSIIASSDVHLRNSEIESGDDNVVIKEGSRNIIAENLQLFRGKGVSIGSLGERAAEAQTITDIIFRKVALDSSLHGARIKTWVGSQGLVQNVTFEAFSMRNVGYGILIDQFYCPRSQRPEGCTREGEDAKSVPAITIQDVRVRDFSGTYLRDDKKVNCVNCKSITFRSFSLQRSADAPAPTQSRYGYSGYGSPHQRPDYDRPGYHSYERR